MSTDLRNAKKLLDTGDYTCVIYKEETFHTATDRGVRPLLNWLEASMDFTGFSAADRVVGRATAFLYVLLGVKEVYARVMSRPAKEVLEAHGIAAEAGTLVDGIINRKGTGPCPFESAVMDIQAPQEALTAICGKMQEMKKGN